MKQIKLLGALDRKDIPVFGSKAVMIGKMLKAGMKVPSGYAISAQHFRKHLKSSGASKLLKIGDFNAVREVILKTKVKRSFLKEIESIIQKLKLERVSVRSSSTLEDSAKGAAAGQYETVLNVPPEKVVEAVKRVWASAFSERAVAYNKYNKIPLSKVGMAVIIQEMIESDVSGVAFSLDPVTLDDNFMVIEACYGLGEALVSGKITPAGFTISKKSVSVTSERPLRQDIMCVGKKEGYTEYIKLPSEYSAGKLMTDSDIVRLASQIMGLEKYFEMYLDAEWCVSKGELYFLQCRPVTGLKPAKNNTDVWSNVNISEVLPGQNYPLIVSTCKEVIELPLKEGCGMPAEVELVRDVKGRLYFNLSEIEYHFRERLGMKNFSASLLFGGQGKEAVEKTKSGFKLKFAGLGLKLLIRTLFLQRWLKKFLKDCPEERKKQIEKIRQANTLPELIGVKKELDLRLVGSLRNAFSALILPVADFGIFDKSAKRSGLSFEEKQILLSGEHSGVELLNAFKVLWEISRGLRKNGELLKRFNEAQNVVGAEKVLAGEPLLKAVYESFFELYGHRCIKEIDFSEPRWSEDRSFILSNLKLYARAEDKDSPFKKERQAAENRKTVMEKLGERLPFWKLKFLNILAERARSGQNKREQVKGALMGFFVPYRSVVLKTAALLVAGGGVKEELDIFSLTRDEFDNLDKTPKPLDYIKGRKLEYIKNRDLFLPDVITDIDLLAGKGKYEPFPGIKELKGLAVSHGLVSGIARVILNPKDIERLSPGEILVTDHTDPGWTPVFVIAAALVTNLGGVLSHSSITAREYGLPAVVNVPDATVIIKDGQLLEVDGNIGTVKIL